MQERLLEQLSLPILEKAVASDSTFALGFLGLAYAQPTNKGLIENTLHAKALSDNVSEGERLMIFAADAKLSGEELLQGQHLRSLVSLFPLDPRAHNLLGNYYFGQQKYPEAIAQYTRAVELDSTFSPPYNMLGYSYECTGNYIESEKAFQRYIELIPSDPNPYDSYAELLLKMGKFNASIKNYRKALEIEPDFYSSYLGIASDLMCQERLEDARAEISILMRPNDDGRRRLGYFALAVISAYERDYKRALYEIEEQYKIALKHQDAGNMASDLILTGDIYFESGQPEQALAKYRESHQVVNDSHLDSDLKTLADLTLLFNESRVDLVMGKMESAKLKTDSFSTATIRAGNPTQIRRSFELLGLLALSSKNYQAAVDAFLMSNLQNPYNLHRLALAYQGLGDISEAREYCQKAADFNGLNDLNYAFCRNKARDLLKSFPKVS
jgi:tetratricopeptide (TPR) repeat protein